MIASQNLSANMSEFSVHTVPADGIALTVALQNDDQVWVPNIYRMATEGSNIWEMCLVEKKIRSICWYFISYFNVQRKMNTKHIIHMRFWKQWKL